MSGNSGVVVGDIDNDGFLDLFFSGSLPSFGIIGPGLGNPGRMFFNDGHGDFIQNNEAHGLELSNEYVTGIARADYDNNGFPGIVIANSVYQLQDPITGISMDAGSGNPVLIKNKGDDNRWLTIRLKGVKSNSMGIGTRIDVYTLDNHQVREVRAGQ